MGCGTTMENPIGKNRATRRLPLDPAVTKVAPEKRAAPGPKKWMVGR